MKPLSATLRATKEKKVLQETSKQPLRKNSRKGVKYKNIIKLSPHRVIIQCENKLDNDSIEK